MEKLNYEIKVEYSYELEEISNILRKLKQGGVLEISHARMDGYLATNVEQLEKKLNELLSKIQNGKEGVNAEMAALF